MTLPDLESDVWPAKGIAPSQPGDMVYSAGEQPIAPYDNRAMWNVTTDIHSLRDTLGSHVERHETGGADELDLQNLRVNGVAALNGDTQNTEIRWVNPESSTSVTRLDIANGIWRQTPDFADAPTFQTGLSVTADIDDTGGTLLYDSAAGDTGKFHHAKHADTAAEAAWADVAGALEADDGTQYQPGDFLTASQDATITGSWTFNQTISGDIDGNAATADHAATADSATNADYATESGNSDKLDGYDAQDLINASQQSAEWNFVDAAEHATVGDRFEWSHQSGTPYDLYRLDIYHESSSGSSGYEFFRLRIGEGGTVDARSEYEYQEQVNWGDTWKWYSTDHFPVANTYGHRETFSSWIIACPQSVNHATEKWPTISQGTLAFGDDMPEFLHHGNLQLDYPAIDTFSLESNTDQSTGRINLWGRNMRTP